MKQYMSTPARRCGQRGLSLIELMIGMTLGLVILGAVLYVFAGNRASYRHQESLSMVQETGRFALELLSRDIRMAGYFGCGNPGFLENLTPGPAHNAAIGFDIAGSTLEVRKGGPVVTAVADMPALNQVEFTVDLQPSVSVGDRLLITDCVFVEDFTVQAIAGNVITATSDLGRTYGTGAQLTRWEPVRYRFDAANERLSRSENLGPFDVIAEGVTDFNLHFGVDSAGGDRSADEYNLPAAMNAPDWPRVVAVRVAFDVQDGNVTQTFSSVVTLRNRAP